MRTEWWVCCLLASGNDQSIEQTGRNYLNSLRIRVWQRQHKNLEGSPFNRRLLDFFFECDAYFSVVDSVCLFLGSGHPTNGCPRPPYFLPSFLAWLTSLAQCSAIRMPGMHHSCEVECAESDETLPQEADVGGMRPATGWH